jgi:hypothetical protein
MVRRRAGDAVRESAVLPRSVATAHGPMVAQVFEPSCTNLTTPFG